jgi:four helix bundle protein
VNRQAEALRARAAAFAVAVVKLCRKLDCSDASRRIATQLIESATSASANYRASCRARSRREFVAKMSIAREEADESLGWLELLVETNALSTEDGQALIKEADELTAIFTASYLTAKRNLDDEDRRRKRPPSTP